MANDKVDPNVQDYSNKYGEETAAELTSTVYPVSSQEAYERINEFRGNSSVWYCELGICNTILFLLPVYSCFNWHSFRVCCSKKRTNYIRCLGYWDMCIIYYPKSACCSSSIVRCKKIPLLSKGRGILVFNYLILEKNDI